MIPKFIKYIFLTLILVSLSANLSAKRKITFLSEDGVTISADLYFKGNEYPYIIMFHQDGSSRGEFNTIAERLVELNYNCLAVDLRYGGTINYVDNETTLSAKQKGAECNYTESGKDVHAAINYAYKISGKPVILLGGLFSASLCIKHSINNGRIAAVVAFDPGEYLKPGYSLKENTKNVDKPMFIASEKKNLSYVKEIFTETDPKYITYFSAASQNNAKGAKVLWPKNENNQEYWLALLMFFSKL